jgi:hypothetical protein
MDKSYIQFEVIKNKNEPSKDGSIKNALKKVLTNALTSVIPKANPDFDSKIKEVKIWLVECHNETGIPEREIGIDKEGKTILKMPYKDNYGYWTDNNLILEDFKHRFSTTEINKEYFEKSWGLFGKNND